jgi:hypothetical protein
MPVNNYKTLKGHPAYPPKTTLVPSTSSAELARSFQGEKYFTA